MNNFKKILFLISLIISIFFLKNYEYNKLNFFILSIICNAYFIISFSKKVNLFHIFNSFFLWMGFWFKILIVHTFFDLNFAELNPQKNYLIFFEESIIVSIIGISAFLLSSIYNYYCSPLNNFDRKIFNDNQTSDFINRYKNIVIIFFITFILIINFINFRYSIYQKGLIGNEEINKYISSIFKWLLIFGLTSLSTVFLFHSLSRKILSVKFLITALFENFVTSISLLSRGMFVNSMAIFFGIIKYYQFYKFKNIKKTIFIFLGSFLILFTMSLVLTKELRTKEFFKKSELESMNLIVVEKNFFLDIVETNLREFFHLVSHRFVGFEGVLSVSSYENKDFNFLKKTMIKSKEKDVIFSKIVKKEDIKNTQSLKKSSYFIKVPGIIGYLYYSGSLVFIFLICFFIGVSITYFEKIVIKFSNGNILFASLISQVIAYRLSHFGYMPYNTYLICLTIILNLLLIYLFYLVINKLSSSN